jgi:hypothetical protein
MGLVEFSAFTGYRGGMMISLLEVRQGFYGHATK